MYKQDCPCFVPLALAGGQGKSTVALMLGRILARKGLPVLFIDADPQASLTAFLEVEPPDDHPTLLEVITNGEDKVPLYSAIHPVPNEDNLFIIPATDQLENANHYLAASGMSLTILKQRIYQVGVNIDPEYKIARNFAMVIIDPPPERSHLALTSMGAGTCWAIPAEANVKGVQSLVRTLDLLKTYQALLSNSTMVGVIPFRAKWVGLNPTKTTKESIAVMEELVGKELMLPNLLESDIYKRAINEQVLPRDIGKEDLEYPITSLLDKIQPYLSADVTSVINNHEPTR
ncbi:plasmid partitioning protein ParA (plasmid) [Cyanobacterium sp. HL-69]|uniref:ParA family protein n=1 Tax=Cyanobacterium sp. HL-69 TaxID=2054282 RepID=UPI000CA10BDE|nr:plasmid partitioning protein ParA [Cyanobacterium sp. HL-69]